MYIERENIVESRMQPIYAVSLIVQTIKSGTYIFYVVCVHNFMQCACVYVCMWICVLI